MNLKKIYFWSKKIHRLSMSVVILLIAVMTFTGTAMKHPQTALGLNLNLLWIKTVHGKFSTIFTIFLVIMITTGLAMYFFPILQKKIIQNIS